MATLTPLPGDPGAVRADASSMHNTAQAIRDAADELRSVTSRLQTQSFAIDKVRDSAREVREVAQRAEVRYRGTAEALDIYAARLADAQQQATTAISRYQSSTAGLDEARAKRDYYFALMVLPGPDQQEMIEQFTYWKNEVASAEHAGDAAAESYHRAEAARDEAAEAAISAINAAIEESGLNDTVWDYLEKAWSLVVEVWETVVLPALDAFIEVLEFIAPILSAISFIVSIAAVFLPALAVVAAALKVTSLILTGIVALGTLVLALNNRRTVTDAIVAGIGFALNFVGPINKPLSGVSGINKSFGLVADAGAWKALVTPGTLLHTALPIQGAASAALSASTKLDITVDLIEQVAWKLIDREAREAVKGATGSAGDLLLGTGAA